MYNVCVLGITHPITSQQIRAGSVWIFQTRFGFQSQVPGFGFFWFRFLHITAMKLLQTHAADKKSKGSEGVELKLLHQLHTCTITSYY